MSFPMQAVKIDSDPEEFDASSYSDPDLLTFRRCNAIRWTFSSTQEREP
jgi:hypothetical protein